MLHTGTKIGQKKEVGLIFHYLKYDIFRFKVVLKFVIIEEIQVTILVKINFFVSGQPLGEPVAQRGPFVMNTQEELAEAMKDYQLQRNGFENAHSWQSVEGNK